MSRLIFLPDRNGKKKEKGGSGLIRCGTEASEWQTLAESWAMRPEEQGEVFDAAYRGALAVALLLDSWKEDAEETTTLRIRTMTADESPLASWVLSARPLAEQERPLHLLMLEKGGKQALLGVVSPVQGLTLARQLGDLTPFLPERVTWFDREKRCFCDPLVLLNEADCDLLLRRMHQMNLTGREANAFRSALAQQLSAQRSSLNDSDPDALTQLTIRASAVLGMMKIPGFSVRTEEYHLQSENALLRCFTQESICVSRGLARQETYCCQGQPFARSSQVLGWTQTHAQNEDETLKRVAQELELMADGSVWWHYELSQALGDYLRQHSGKQLLPAVREHLAMLQAQEEESSRQVQGTVTLRFPWLENSGAIQALLHKALGDGWEEAAEQPFSDRLSCMTGYQLGDQTLRTCCTLEDAQMIPPLSRTLAEMVARQEETLALDSFRYQVEEDGSVTASFLLRGQGTIRLMRTYAPEEQLFLAQPPLMAVYPCAPMDFWQSYQVLAKGGEAEVAAWEDGAWRKVPKQPDWAVQHVTVYPKMLLLEKDGQVLGAVPNFLPKEKQKTAVPGEATAAIDLGTAATAVTLKLDGREVSAAHRPLLRMLLMDAAAQGEEDLLENILVDEMMNSLSRSDDMIPTAVILSGQGDSPIRDGFIYRPQSLTELAAREEKRLLTGFKWRSDSAGVRARRLLICQLMMDTALSAVMQGAKSLSWRVAIEDDMGDGGRQAVLSEIEEGAKAVQVACGCLAVPGTKQVDWAGETEAMATFLRTSGGMRGSFVGVDSGAGSLRVALFLQTRITPARMSSTPYGTQMTLYEMYAHQPEKIAYDFGGCGGALLASAQQLAEVFSDSANTRMHVGKACMMLDRLLEEQAAPLAMHLNARLNAGQVTYLQSVAVEYLAGVAFIAGLLWQDVQADSMLNHYLPNRLPVALTGRGSALMNLLPGNIVSNLAQVVSAATGRVTAPGNIDVQLIHDGQWAVSRGLGEMKTLDKPVETSPMRRNQSFSEMMLRLMQTLLTIAPAHMWLLHPGMGDQLGRMTSAGTDTIRRTAAQCYDEQEEMAALVMKFLSELRKAPIEQDKLASPGN